MRGNSVYKKLFVALLALPNLAAAFSSTSLLFLPGALWNQNERLVSNMGQDATATTWAVTCTSTTSCDLPSPYMVYTIGVSTMQMSNTATAPNFDIACTITPPVAAACSGHVTGVGFATAMNANYLSSYGYRQVTITDNFAAAAATTSSSPSKTLAPTSSTGGSGSKITSSVTGPTGVNSGILNSYSGGSGSGSGGATSTGKQSAGGGLEGNGVGATGTSKSKGAAPMVTGMMGEMGMMAAVAVVGGAVGF